MEVKEAQLKKNRLLSNLESDLLKLRNRMVDNQTYNSEIYAHWESKLTQECEKEVDLVREGLLFYLRYALRPDEGVVASPYKIDYSLTEEERFYIVRDYYLEAYPDREALFEAFRADTVAPKYLGELYKPLYDYFLSLA